LKEQEPEPEESILEEEQEEIKTTKKILQSLQEW
jgi:hypothetical protein